MAQFIRKRSSTADHVPGQVLLRARRDLERETNACRAAYSWSTAGIGSFLDEAFGVC
ncbi:MAG TPA: hypothetical protein VMI06_00185 [Terriglobia bacterium]|nr:hypothetical protein [Terriglobia bacterium]